MPSERVNGGMIGSRRRNSKAAVVEICQGALVWKWGTVVKGVSGEVVRSAESSAGVEWRILRNLKSFSRSEISRSEICWLMVSIFCGGWAKV